MYTSVPVYSRFFINIHLLLGDNFWNVIESNEHVYWWGLRVFLIFILPPVYDIDVQYCTAFKKDYSLSPHATYCGGDIASLTVFMCVFVYKILRTRL